MIIKGTSMKYRRYKASRQRKLPNWILKACAHAWDNGKCKMCGRVEG